MTQSKQPSPTADDTPVPDEPRRLTPEAQRALAEAEQRRREQAAQAVPSEREVGGPEGPEPTRYGDWEKGGIASDF